MLNIENLSISFGAESLLDNISFQIHEGEKISLLGRNGAGKSTLMKIINRDIEPDSGNLYFNSNFKTAVLPQDVPEEIEGKVYDIISSGYHAPDDVTNKDEQLKLHETDRVLSMLQINGDLIFNTLSAGMKRRVLLGKAIVNDPDILLLDEPTNHLDMEAIQWLEDFMKRYEKTILYVTHDRKFLEKTASRIIEIDRGKLFDWKCDYNTFLKRKNEWLDAEEKQNAVFDKKLAEEEKWIRKGIKARRTRNEWRVRALIKMREERSQRRVVQGKSNLAINEADRSGKIVSEVNNVSFSYGDNSILKDFTTIISRGDKIGVIGKNGCGKSTLVKILLGELTPTVGSVKTGTNLELIYFDQLRDQIDPDKTVKENVCGNKDIITFQGKSKHIVGYLQNFLFMPDRINVKAKVLSGGEKNRLMLAKLFTYPANMIVLDEPTNDLDIETVELLEEILFDFNGTVVTISHDRSFLNNVVTSIISFDDDGVLREYAGGFDDYVVQRSGSLQGKNEKETNKKNDYREEKRRKNRESKMSNKELKELDNIPVEVEKLEKEKELLYSELSDPDLYKNNPDRCSEIQSLLKNIDEDIEKLLERWEELEQKKEKFESMKQ